MSEKQFFFFPFLLSANKNVEISEEIDNKQSCKSFNKLLKICHLLFLRVLANYNLVRLVNDKDCVK